MRVILIVPIGYIPEWLIKDVAEFVDSYYSQRGVPVKAGSPLSESLFLSAYHPFRRQFLGGAFLPMLSEIGRRAGALAAVGITKVDLYERGMNFVFGVASEKLRSAVVSIHRLRPEFYGKPSNDELLIERTVKEVMHELGHVFGLSHCPNVRCVMHFSNSVYDTDVKLPYYCPNCEQKLLQNLEVVL
ncbi:archaemetzincin family Zn-dependent metalloprotease [Thermococcus peptonophilus]|uniref:archaemetzincin family Zn-dependent metalloprotease n=1 Tax=Thermococcus peptonophilus TaxID=53952 RepID=UPI0009EEDE5B|nr:archaemetzincin family Zn-dependent metalloprotease [Thermococcus peptonophilus]